MPPWFYVESDQRRGPIREEELIQLLRLGNLPADVLVWSPGRNTWARADEVAELLARLPPPLPREDSVPRADADPPPAPRAMTQPVAAEAGGPAASAGARPDSGSSHLGSRWDKWLTLSAVILALNIAGFTFLLSPSRAMPIVVAQTLGEVAGRLAFVSAVLSASVPRLRKRFLVAWLLTFGIPMGVMLGVASFAPSSGDRSAGNLMKLAQGDAGSGEKLSPDNPLATVGALLAEVAASLDSMEKEIEAVGTLDVFDLTVLADKKRLARETAARNRQHEILLRYQRVVLANIDGWELRFPSTGDATVQLAKDITRKGLSGGREKFQKMFEMRLGSLECERRFLQFMLRTVGQYEIYNGKLLSPGGAWDRNYEALSRAIVDIRKEQQQQTAMEQERLRQQRQGLTKELAGLR